LLLPLEEGESLGLDQPAVRASGLVFVFFGFVALKRGERGREGGKGNE